MQWRACFRDLVTHLIRVYCTNLYDPMNETSKTGRGADGVVCSLQLSDSEQIACTLWLEFVSGAVGMRFAKNKTHMEVDEDLKAVHLSRFLLLLFCV